MHAHLKKNFTLRSCHLLILILIALGANANVNAIDFNKVRARDWQDEIHFLVVNQDIYNHWEHGWNASVSRKEVLDHLTSLYNHINATRDKNEEEYLLLGDIAHYLYNLETEEYYQKAVDNYRSAETKAPADYRAYWFLANHYALSARQVMSIETYQKSLALVSSQKPAHHLFWADYAIACANAGMLSTARYAIEKSTEILGQTSYIEEQLKPIIDGTLRTPSPDTSFTAKDMWTYADRSGKPSFSNYSLGIRMTMDPTWRFSPMDFKNRGAFTIIKPSDVKTGDGQTIGYTILVSVKATSSSQKLEDGLEPLIGKYKNRTPVRFNIGNLSNCLAYEIQDPEMYVKWGGGHLYVIALERDVPAHPGMLLDVPGELPTGGEKGKVTYFTQVQKYSRFPTKLYYYILLDTCELIHDKSLAAFRTFLSNGVMIE